MRQRVKERTQPFGRQGTAAFPVPFVDADALPADHVEAAVAALQEVGDPVVVTAVFPCHDILLWGNGAADLTVATFPVLDDIEAGIVPIADVQGPFPVFIQAGHTLVVGSDPELSVPGLQDGGHLGGRDCLHLLQTGT